MTYTCLACGETAADVRLRLVEVDPTRTTEVRLPATHRDGAVEFIQVVPERYLAEPRCRDTAACRLRELALPDPMETL